MDQFTYAERATDWRGNNNIADSIFHQMQREPNPVPKHIVMSAGTGGTSATIGRYIRCHGYDTRLMVVDPENSVFLPYWQDRDATLRSPVGSKIEGIGRPRVEPSFIPDVVDEMLRVPDAASVATAHWLETQLGRKVGASTGTNMWERCRSQPECATPERPVLSSRCCVTAANAISTPITIPSGLTITLAI